MCHSRCRAPRSVARKGLGAVTHWEGAAGEAREIKIFLMAWVTRARYTRFFPCPSGGAPMALPAHVDRRTYYVRVHASHPIGQFVARDIVKLFQIGVPAIHADGTFHVDRCLASKIEALLRDQGEYSGSSDMASWASV